MFRYHIAVAIEVGARNREWEGDIDAPDGRMAVLIALDHNHANPSEEAGELLHYIHVSPPRRLT